MRHGLHATGWIVPNATALSGEQLGIAYRSRDDERDIHSPTGTTAVVSARLQQKTDRPLTFSDWNRSSMLVVTLSQSI
jgi:hypothetical protein